jgi:hypothetical protein
MTHMTLIRKAARGRDIKLNGCLSFNKSAEALEGMGESVLPEIEQFLSKEFRSDVPADQMERLPWLGLANVLHVYFELASESHKGDPGSFLLSLHGWLREEAMRVVFVIWGVAVNPRRERRLPDRLEHAVERLSVSGSLRERDFAKRLLRHLNGKRPAMRRALSFAKK